MATKASKRNPNTYTSGDPQDPTSYDTSRPESDSPQEVREGAETPAMQNREQEAKKGNKPTPDAEGVSTRS